MRDLYEKARKVDGITVEMVSTWMRAQSNKQTNNYKNYNSNTAPFPKYEFQIDLMDVTRLLRDVGSEITSQLRYGLVCIDIFSKKCHIVPIENKDGDDVYKAVMECFKVVDLPLSIYSDDEGASVFICVLHFFTAFNFFWSLFDNGLSLLYLIFWVLMMIDLNFLLPFFGISAKSFFNR